MSKALMQYVYFDTQINGDHFYCLIANYIS